MRRYSYLLFSLFLALTFAACDSDGDGDSNGNGNGNSDIGNANVTISGDVSGSFSGSAIFGADAEDGTGFTIVLFDQTITTLATGQFVAMGTDGERPSPGQYDFEAASGVSFGGGYFSSDGSTTGTIVSAQSGTLTITSSSSDQVSGNFTFTGQAISNGGVAGTATVSGSFTAELINEFNVPDF